MRRSTHDLPSFSQLNLYRTYQHNNNEVILLVETDSCLSCAKLYECSSKPGDTCDKYEYEQPDKSAITTRYLKAVKKLNEAIAELKQAEVGLGILEKMDKAKNEKPT
jgi:hypothetical protein